jgi:hypothetical protein
MGGLWNNSSPNDTVDRRRHPSDKQIKEKRREDREDDGLKEHVDREREEDEKMREEERGREGEKTKIKLENDAFSHIIPELDDSKLSENSIFDISSLTDSSIIISFNVNILFTITFSSTPIFFNFSLSLSFFFFSSSSKMCVIPYSIFSHGSTILPHRFTSNPVSLTTIFPSPNSSKKRSRFIGKLNIESSPINNSSRFTSPDNGNAKANCEVEIVLFKDVVFIYIFFPYVASFDVNVIPLNKNEEGLFETSKYRNPPLPSPSLCFE